MFKIVLVLVYLGVSFFAVSATFSRGLAWSEALAALVPGFVMLVALHVVLDRSLAGKGHHGSAYRWWRFGVVWLLVVGAFVAVVTHNQLEDDLALAAMDAQYGGTQRGSYNLYEAYAKEDALGRKVGLAMTAFGLVALGFAVPRRRRARHSIE